MKYKLTKKQKKMRNRIIIAIALLAVTAVTLHFVEVPWWTELVLYMIPYVIAGYDVLKTAFINLIHGQIFDALLSDRRAFPEHRGRKIQEIHRKAYGYQT